MIIDEFAKDFDALLFVVRGPIFAPDEHGLVGVLAATSRQDQLLGLEVPFDHAVISRAAAVEGSNGMGNPLSVTGIRYGCSKERVEHVR